jgi:tetratricopeptide (TPR) repeat protein
MGITLRHVVWTSATLALGSSFYVLTVEPLDPQRMVRAGAIGRTPHRELLISSVRASLATGQLADAERHVGELRKHYPEDPSAMYFQAVVAGFMDQNTREQGYWDELADYTRTLKSWPNRYTEIELGYYRAWALTMTGQIEQGRVLFARIASELREWALSNDGLITNPMTHYNLACYLAMSGEPERAMEHWASAVDRGYGLRVADQGGWWMVDPDLESLHDNPEFWQIGARAMSAYPSPESIEGSDTLDGVEVIEQLDAPQKPMPIPEIPAAGDGEGGQG